MEGFCAGAIVGFKCEGGLSMVGGFLQGIEEGRE